MKKNAHARLHSLQKKIFRALRAEADRLLGTMPEAIQRYEREFNQDFRNLPRRKLPSIAKRELIGEIRKADVTFIADFHSFSQAQRTALRILRDAVRKGENWALGIELVSSDAQDALDQFQAGELSLEEFHETVRYADWGFPWANYAPLFAWARENGVRLIALNRPSELKSLHFPSGATVRKIRSDSELNDRDRWAAGIITDLFAQATEKFRMVVLYGELHVSRSHLPAHLQEVSASFLKKPLTSVTVHQNHDGLFWHLARRHKELTSEIIRLGNNLFCVLSSTPWTKLESLVTWAEGGIAANESTGETSVDFLSMSRTYGHAIAEFLGMQAPSFDSFMVYTIGEADFVDDLSRSQFSAQELRLIRFHVMGNHRIYIPGAQVGYLGTPNQNSLSELAAAHLFHMSARSENLFSRDAESFYRLVLESAFAFLGSLIINPRRKCDLREDHENRLQALRRKARETFQLERLSREIALAVLKAEGARRKNPPPAALKRALQSSSTLGATMIAAKFVGQILAKRMYLGIISESLPLESVRALAKNHGPSFRDRYFELLKGISPQKTAPTKTASL